MRYFCLVLYVLTSITACSWRSHFEEPAKPIVADVAKSRFNSKEDRTGPRSYYASGNRVAVSTHGAHATQAARKIFEAGGNIIDAAVAASFVISVERPQSTGLGGGGFMLYREAKTGEVYAIDFRERAPLKATEMMFLDASGKYDPQRARNEVLSVAVPGLVAGLYEIHTKFGSLPFEKVVQPAIEIAERGFAIYPELARALEIRSAHLSRDPGARSIFLDKNGKPWPVGHVLVQKDLAQTLRLVASKGRDGFYKGEVARKLVDFMKSRKGLITEADLREYQVIWRRPVKGAYKGFEIYSMPPPSSGGIHVIQFLGFLENDPLYRFGFMSAKSIHLAAAALQSAFADRAHYLGDPDFVSVPTATLISPAYIAGRRKSVDPARARSAEEVAPGDITAYESEETTHLSIMDKEGNAVATTQTINGLMGAALVATGTGIVLNNEMDDFASPDGSANMFGAIGGKANAVAPKKTPLSSMSPTLLIRDGQVYMAVGAPGGTRIISCVAQTILNWIEFRMPLQDAVATVRYHHQWKPDELLIEPPGPGADVVKRLEEMGYRVNLKPIGCKVMAVARESNRLNAVADPRDIGTSWAE